MTAKDIKLLAYLVVSKLSYWINNNKKTFLKQSVLSRNNVHDCDLS